MLPDKYSLQSAKAEKGEFPDQNHRWWIARSLVEKRLLQKIELFQYPNASFKL